MRLAVCVKRVGAVGDDVEFNDSGRSVAMDYLDYALNEWDAAATEEALQLRDAAGGGEVVVVTVGDKDAEKALVQCLAMGADRAVRVASDDPDLIDPFSIAQLLAVAVQPEQPDLVLCGAQSSDAGQGATGCALAAYLDLPLATLVTKVERGSTSPIVVHRELEGGVVDVVEIQAPAVLTIQTGINEPRYVTVRAVQQAQRLAVQVIDADAAMADGPSYRVRRMYEPPKAAAQMIGGDASAIAARITTIVREALA
jgi:electron transfer flavoprotein beta subunit